MKRATRGSPGRHRLADVLVAAALVAASAALPGATAAQAQPTSGFALRLPVSTEQASGLHTVELSEAVHRASLSADLRDLRIFNARGEALALAPLPLSPSPAPPVDIGPEVPMVPLPAPQETRDRVLSDFALRIEKEGGKAVIELSPATVTAAVGGPSAVGGYLIDLRRAHEEHKARMLPGVLRLKFASTAPDFAGRVQLFASDNLVDWQALGGGALVLSRQFGDLIERGDFEIPRVPPFVRVTWTGDRVPLLEHARFAPRTTAAPPPLPRAALSVSRGEAVKGAAETFYVDLPVGLPITRLRIRASRDNQVVRVRVWRRNDTPPLQRLHASPLPRRAPASWLAEGDGLQTVFRLSRGGEWIENDMFRLSARSTQLRIDVVDASFGELPTVEAEWRPGRYAFAADGAAPFTLAVGLADAAPGPMFDASPMLPADDPAGLRLPRARLVGGAAFAATERPGVATERAARLSRDPGAAKYLLWAVLAIAIALLAAMAWRIGAQLRSAPRAAPDEPRGHE